jgi:exopolysaccharide production protein ExoQ
MQFSKRPTLGLSRPRSPRAVSQDVRAASGAAPTVDSPAAGLPLYERVIFLSAALIYWTDILRQIFPGVDSASVEFRAIHFGFYGAFIVLLARNIPALLDTIRRAPLLIAFLLLPLVSALWSVNPPETVTRAVALLGSSLFGIYVATHVQARSALHMLGWTAALAALLSLFLIAFVPSVGLMSEGEYVNVWSGAYIHKNGMGQMATLGAIISLILLLTEGVRRNPVLGIGLALNLLLLAGSRSLTSQIVFAASVVLIFTVGRCVRFVFDNVALVGLVVAPIALIIGATVSVDDLFVLLASFGKDASMSSRIPLWQILAGFIENSFWLGYGYEAFFTEANFAIRVIEGKLYFKPYYSHNGYIETWIALGAVGFLAMASLFVRFTWVAAIKLYQDDRNPLYLLCFVYAPLFLIQNTAEVTILQRNSMSWCLFVMLYVYLVRVRPTEPARPTPRALPGQSQRLPVT